MREAYRELQGEHYLKVLEELHKNLQPDSYLEIGTRTGSSLRLAQCESIAIDPQFKIKAEIVGSKPRLTLYQQTSDGFFAENPPGSLFGGRKLDMSFIDGMHLFEFLLRDFINTEKHCCKNSVITIHDCIPGDSYVTRRVENDPIAKHSEHPNWWTGDVWKILPTLWKFRKDLRIHCVDAKPTGLVVVTNLDPLNTVLEHNYDAIVDEFVNRGILEYGLDKFLSDCKLVPTSAVMASSLSLA